MTHTLRTTVVVAALVGTALLASPAAANASTIYPPSDACSVSPTTTAPGGTIVFSCADGTFAATEPVTITVTGENGDAAGFGFVKFAITTGAFNTESGASGQLADTDITLPDNASGVYNIAAVSASSVGGTASVTVASDDGLPGTGGDSSALALWAGGGLVLLAGGAVALMAAARRRRS